LIIVKKEFADLILHNANLITLDPRQAGARAIATKDERIIAVGDEGEILGLAGPRTHVIDARGLTVIPGLNDNHIHAVSMGNFYQYPLLFGKTAAGIIAALKQHYQNIKPGKLILGYAWDYTTCPSPSKELLDAAFPDNPVILRQYSGHAMWVNSRVLQKLIRKKKHAPASVGDIVTGADNSPTGIIRGTIVYGSHKQELVRRVLDPVLHKKLMKNALQRLREAGITSVQDNTWQPFTVWLLHGLKKRGELTARFSCWPFGQYRLLAKSMAFCPYDRTWIRRGPEKYIVDGAFSPHTAWMTDPYEGEPDNRGDSVLSTAALRKIVLSGVKRKKQLAFHAIGDRAIHEVVGAVEETAREYPLVKNLRIRLEHGQIIQPADIPRLKQLGMLVAAQPTALAQPERDASLFGKERFARLYPYHSVLAAGVPLSFGSDIPGEIEYNPFIAMYRAVSRQGLATSKSAYAREEALSVAEALACYTRGSAYAEFMEHEKGMLKPGMLADFIVLSDNLLKTDVGRLPQIKVVLTVVGGRVVFGKL
jgi:predicted amidohydrolase YtcJ